MSNGQCSNCGAGMSCGCQKRKAKDGTSACSKCLASYEAKLNAEKSPEIQNITPQTQNEWGAHRYKKG